MSRMPRRGTMAQKLNDVSPEKLRLMLFKFDRQSLVNLYMQMHETIKGADFRGDEPECLDLQRKKQIVVTEMVRRGYLTHADNPEWITAQRKIKKRRVF